MIQGTAKLSRVRSLSVIDLWSSLTVLCHALRVVNDALVGAVSLVLLLIWPSGPLRCWRLVGSAPSSIRSQRRRLKNPKRKYGYRRCRKGVGERRRWRQVDASWLPLVDRRRPLVGFGKSSRTVKALGSANPSDILSQSHLS